jgi:hypothetical protein
MPALTTTQIDSTEIGKENSIAFSHFTLEASKSLSFHKKAFENSSLYFNLQFHFTLQRLILIFPISYLNLPSARIS